MPLKAFLDSFESARGWLEEIGFRDPPAAHRNFVAIAERGIPLDLFLELFQQLHAYLPACPDPDMAINNLERMLASVRSKLSVITFLVRKPRSLPVLLQLFSTSQYFSDLIIANPEYFDFLWEQGHAALDPVALKNEIASELAIFGEDEDRVLNCLRRFRQREMLRIGFRDIARGEPLERITESISDLADSLVDIALATAVRWRTQRHGQPIADGQTARLVILALGKLGGSELNYSSDIDLVALYDRDGMTDGRRSISNADFFAHVVRDLVRLLSTNTARGQAFRVDLRLRPHGNTGPLCLSLRETLAYYDKHGRTWERQALIKARPIAGSMALGEEFLSAIESFVFRRYLTFEEINDIKSVKRTIEAKTRSAGGDTADLKTGHGGIRDIEFVTQFLQLVNGGALPQVRERNTLAALVKLAAAGCINRDEHSVLETGYRFLRRAEHRLQFMFDLQTHRLPPVAEEVDRLARRLGYVDSDRSTSRARFLDDLVRLTEQHRAILDRLLHDLFPDDPGGGEPETDLILDPNPSTAQIANVLGKYQFRDADAAYKGLIRLATEEIPFLSSIRCRHFLASVAPRLLQAVAGTADPDMALVNLEKVTASLGAKGVLWECCSRNRPLLNLYVQLCSSSQFLSEILIKNPGMIDELLDTLVLNRRPTLEQLREELTGLLRGARDVAPILHSFKDTKLLDIGVRDILGKSSLQETTRELSELAECIVVAVLELHYAEAVAELGMPGRDDGSPVSFVLLGLGKLGGMELNYHSDLDVVMVYEADGKTQSLADARREPTSNYHFFTELGQRLARTAGRMGPLGRLYPIDFRLRPTGRSGSLVIPFEKFQEYYQNQAALWERQALTRARVLRGAGPLADRVSAAVRQAIAGVPWRPELVDEIMQMRQRLEENRPTLDIKRGAGGMMDVEFAVQLAQIKYGARRPELLEPNVWKCLERIRDAGLWPDERVYVFYDGYSFLRMVESRLRIVQNVCRDDLPDDPADRLTLAARLGYEGAAAADDLTRDLARHTAAIRNQFLRCLEDERNRP